MKCMGRVVRELIDYNRKETLSDNDEYRKLIVSIYYPGEIHREDIKSSSSYINLFQPKIREVMDIFRKMGAENTRLLNLEGDFYSDVEVLESQNKYNVILYSPGFGIGRDMYLFNIRELVNKGFIVVAVEATYDSIFTVFKNGDMIHQSQYVASVDSLDFNSLKQLINIRVMDLEFVIKYLSTLNEEDIKWKHRFNLDNLGVIGHSLGAATIVELAKREERIKAVIMLDGSFHLINYKPNMLDVPLLSLRKEEANYRELRRFMEEEIAFQYSFGQHKLYECLDGYKKFIKITSADHMTFTDIPNILKREKEIESVKDKYKTINQLVSSFFEEYLLKKRNKFKELIKIENKNDKFSIIDKNGNVVY